LGELTRCAPEQMLPHERRFGVDKRHHVLQLIAETERSARLVVAAARPQAARDRLVEQPPVGEDVDRRVGRVYLYRAERVLPVRSYRVQRGAGGGRSLEPLQQGTGIGGVAT